MTSSKVRLAVCEPSLILHTHFVAPTIQAYQDRLERLGSSGNNKSSLSSLVCLDMFGLVKTKQPGKALASSCGQMMLLSLLVGKMGAFEHDLCQLVVYEMKFDMQKQ